MRRIVYSRRAQRDLSEIWDYIAADNVDAADKVCQRVRTDLEMVAATPGIGHRRPDVKDDRFRCWKVHSYIVVYRYTSKTVTVVRIVHGARDFRKLFGRQ